MRRLVNGATTRTLRVLAPHLLAATACGGGGDADMSCPGIMRYLSGLTMDRTLDLPYAAADLAHVDLTIDGVWQGVDATADTGGGFYGGTLRLGRAPDGRTTLHLEFTRLPEPVRPAVLVRVRIRTVKGDASATATGSLRFVPQGCGSDPVATTF